MSGFCLSSTLDRVSMSRSSAAAAAAYLRQCRARAITTQGPSGSRTLSTSSSQATQTPQYRTTSLPITAPTRPSSIYTATKTPAPTATSITQPAPSTLRTFVTTKSNHNITESSSTSSSSASAGVPPPPPSPSSSSTSTSSTTIILQNPRTDEDGTTMSIAISPRAAHRLSQITSSASTPQHLRVTVTSGGCHGFQYLMSLEDSSEIDAEDDTVFAATEQGAASTSPDPSDCAKANAGQAQVVLDEPSLELLKGSTIDYTTELIGSQFKIIGNPRAKSSCGCGTSFDIE